MHLLKLNQSWNAKKEKNTLFLGFKIVNFEFVFLRLFFYVKGSFMPIFTKKVIFRPLGIFLKMKTLPHVCRLHALKIWIGTSKIIPDLWLSAVLCPTKKIKKITPPYSAHALAHTRLYRIRRTPCKNRAHKSAWLSLSTLGSTCMHASAYSESVKCHVLNYSLIFSFFWSYNFKKYKNLIIWDLFSLFHFGLILNLLTFKWQNVFFK